MPDDNRYFAIVFARTEANRVRTEAAITGSSERHAIWLASHFTSSGEGAIALSRCHSAAPQRGSNIKILAQFGEALAISSNILALKKALGHLEFLIDVQEPARNAQDA
jgi:hypothetical protein